MRLEYPDYRQSLTDAANVHVLLMATKLSTGLW